MEFRYSDLEDEVRDGFYVHSLMKSCWMAQLGVLERIDSICQKHNIQYQAEWGTLLGTVRHGGFIPWDDDMDISMKRPDYNKFLKVAKEELPESYHIMSYRNDADYWDVMARVVNSETVHFENEFLEENYNFPFSTGIDIFPMDFLPTNEGERKVLKEVTDAVKDVADSYGAGFLKGEELEKHLELLEFLCNRKISREGDLRQNLYDIVVSLYALYTEEESEEIALMPLWLEKGRHYYPKEFYASTARLPFDKITIPVPIAYDSVLKKKYGDYMKMVRKGGGHDYPYYNKQIKDLEGYGVTFPKYRFADRVIRETSKEQKEIADLEIEKLFVLENAHASLGKLLLVQENETAMQLLIKCQECVLAIGEKIEKEVADCEKIITTLETYCEWIFQIYQVLQTGDSIDPEAVIRILQEQLSFVKEEFAKEYKRKKKIVFITDKAARWKSLKSIWKAAKKDKNCNVSVIVVPYCYRRMDGTIIEEHYEGDLFPEEVEVIDIQSINLEEYRPDVIFINSPYDEWNYYSSIHPHFYSSNLVKWCDKLVYIPWFTLTDFTKEDERGWQSMQHFVTMPGVVNADRVIVQSEQMKENYIEYLTEWAGEETRSIWEEKILGIGSPMMDAKEEEPEKIIPEEWKKYFYKEDGSMKKAVLYHVNASSFMDYKEKVTEKINNVLKIFKESKDDICLLWSWNTIMEQTVEISCPELWKAFKQMIREFQDEDWGIYVENITAEEVVSLTDAFYGDGCKLSQAIVMAEKPVMLQNYDI